MGLNGLGSPFGFETGMNELTDTQVHRLNGLGSPFGFETIRNRVPDIGKCMAKWPGKPVRV